MYSERVPDDNTHSIGDLARLTGLNVRTIRYYIAQGLIPASGESGPGAHYGQGHLDRLRLTKRLQQQHLPLAEIRGRLAVLTDDEVAGLLDTTPEPGAPETSALDYVRSVLGSAPPMSGPPAPPARTPAAAPLAATPAEFGAPPALGPQPAAALIGRGMPRMKDVPAPDSRVAAAEARATVAARAPKPSTTESQPLERSQWERLSLGANIELHVRRPLGRLEQRRVDRLITIARQVLKEDGV